MTMIARGKTVSDFDFTASEQGDYDVVGFQSRETRAAPPTPPPVQNLPPAVPDPALVSPLPKPRPSASSASSDTTPPPGPRSAISDGQASGLCAVCSEPKAGKQAFCKLHKRASQNIDTAGLSLLRTRGMIL